MARDWVEWHAAYDRPESSLVARLAVVTGFVSDALDRASPGPIRCLSLCAGDARDLGGALLAHDRANDVVGAVVELDPALAERARAQLADVAGGLDVRVADAGDPAVFADVLPVDLLLLVGIFGNIGDADIRTTIAAVPALCRPGATVLWSRHRREPDATPMIRAAFDEIGATPLAFESPGAGSFAIGAERAGDDMASRGLPHRLFSFRDDLW